MCSKLDIPYEFKANIDNALTKYRYLWNAENAPLGNVKVDFPLEEGEICHAAGQAALCEVKTVAKEDNYYQLTRKLRIDETISFKGEHIEHPQVMEETAVIIDAGYLFLTNSRIIYLSKKLAKQIRLDDLKTADLSSNIIEAHQNDGQSLSFKMQDDAAEVMFAILRRIFKRQEPEMKDLIRFVRPQDAARILEIYAPYITDTVISFEYEVPTPEDFFRAR